VGAFLSWGRFFASLRYAQNDMLVDSPQGWVWRLGCARDGQPPFDRLRAKQERRGELNAGAPLCVFACCLLAFRRKGAGAATYGAIVNVLSLMSKMVGSAASLMRTKHSSELAAGGYHE
jgi:hypothetical protein